MAKESTALIKLKSVTKSYPIGKQDLYQALNGIDLEIQSGEFVAITGPSGSGKSTLMHILGALDSPTTGEYSLKGRRIETYNEDQLAEIRNKEIGFVFQFFNLLPKTTVFKNVERPMLFAGVEDSERAKRTMEVLNQVGIAEKAQNLSNHISGGQIQRVAIARALVMNPSVILADEPTGNLDSKTSLEILNILKNLNKEGRTIVMITHEEELARMAKRQIKIVDGKIVSDKRFKS